MSKSWRRRRRIDFKINRISLNIGNHEFLITDRFTLIKGRFEKSFLKNLQKDNFLDNIEDFNLFYLEDFVKIIQNQKIEFQDTWGLQ